MKTTINGQKFELSETSGVFLDKYLSKMKRFIDKNNIEMDVYDDIEERIAEGFIESLGNKKTKKISDKAVINIINELGEPDEIFADMGEEDSQKTFSKNNFKQYLSEINFKQYFSLGEGPLTRDSENGILSGVCYGIARKYGWDPIWVRLAFIFGTFLWGMTILLYIILIFLLPDTGLSNKKKAAKVKPVNKVKDVAKKQLEKIKSMPIRENIQEKTLYVKKRRIIPTLFNSLISLIKGLIKFIFHFARIILACLLFLICLPVLTSFLFVSGFIFSDITIDNQIMFSQIDIWLKIGIVGLLFSLFFIIFGIFLKLLKGKTFATALMINGVIGIFIFAFVGGTGFVKTLSEYQNTYTHSELYELDVDTLTVDNLHGFGNPESFIQGANWIDRVSFERTSSGSLSLQVISTLNTQNKQEANEIFAAMTPLTPSVQDSLDFGLSGQSSFDRVVPYGFLRRELVFYIPEDTQVELGDIHIQNFSGHVSGLYYTSDDKIRAAYGFWRCRNTKLAYSGELEGFVCSD